MKPIVLLMISAIFLVGASSKQDEKTGLVWQDNQDVAKIEKSYTEAKKYCEQLNVDGFGDWRLPTLAEAYTIVDLTRDRPALKNGFEMRIGEHFWTATLFAGNPEKEAWRLSMSYGDAEPYSQHRTEHIRCVRGDAKH